MSREALLQRCTASKQNMEALLCNILRHAACACDHAIQQRSGVCKLFDCSAAQPTAEHHTSGSTRDSFALGTIPDKVC